MFEVALQIAANAAMILGIIICGLLFSFTLWFVGLLIRELAKTIVASPLEEAARIVAVIFVFTAMGIFTPLARFMTLAFVVLLFAEVVSPHPVFRPILDWANRRIDDLCGRIRTWRNNIQ